MTQSLIMYFLQHHTHVKACLKTRQQQSLEEIKSNLSQTHILHCTIFIFMTVASYTTKQCRNSSLWQPHYARSFLVDTCRKEMKDIYFNLCILKVQNQPLLQGLIIYPLIVIVNSHSKHLYSSNTVSKTVKTENCSTLTQYYH